MYCKEKMKIEIVAIGKMNNINQKLIFDDYTKRIRNIKLIEIPSKNNFPDNPNLTKNHECEQILKYLKGKLVICMSEEGRQFTSPQFASFLHKSYQEQEKTISFVIGGAFGLDERIKKGSHQIISLGKMTFPHMLARILLIEQIYRANTIILGHPYHK